jgi:hypothetical protein
MKVFKVLIAMSVATIVLISTGPVSAVPVQKFRNCAAISKDYPTGVARSVSAANAALRAGFERPAVRKNIYQANIRLDRKKSGTVCLVAIQPPTEVMDYRVQPSPGTGEPSIWVRWKPPATGTGPFVYDIFLDGQLAKTEDRFDFAFFYNLAPSTTYTVEVLARNIAGPGPRLSAQVTTLSAEAARGLVEVVYSVTGSAGSVSITQRNVGGGTEQYDSSLPLSRSFWIRPGSFLYISAQNNGDSGDVSCAITRSGRTVQTASSSGAYVIATCSGTA